MSTLRIALVQTPVIWKSKSENLKHYSKLLDGINDQIDLIVLPEMFQTGFVMQTYGIAEGMEGETIQWMREQALEKKCCISGSLIIKVGNVYFNRFTFVGDDGVVQHYDKRHLFSYAGENEEYRAGIEDVFIKLKSWNILPRICYDLRFPVWNRQAKNADLLLITANWPSGRIAHWDALLRARAIENQIYTVGVNRIGKDGNDLDYCGHSSVLKFDGSYIKKLEDEEQLLIVELEKQEQQKYRKKFAFLEDADFYNIIP